MANRYYISGGTGGWNNTNNWSTASGSTSGASVPGASDIAIFDNNSPSCTTDANVNVLGISITSGYTGTITQGAFTITVGSSSWTQAGGTFTGSASSISAVSFTLSGGTFNSTSGNFSVSTNFSNIGGIFNHNNGTVTLVSNTGQVITNGNNFYNLYVNKAGGVVPVIAGSNIIVNGNLSMVQTGFLVSFSGLDCELKGDALFNCAATNAGSKLIINGTGVQNISAGGGANGNCNLTIEINKPSGVVNYLSDIGFTGGQYKVISGSVSWNQHKARYGTNRAPNFTNATFYDLEIAGAGVYQPTLSTDLIVLNDFTGTTISSMIGTGNLYVGGDVIIASTSTGFLQPFIFNGTGVQTISAQSLTTNSYGFNIEVNKPSGEVMLLSNLATTKTAHRILVTNGTLNLNGFNCSQTGASSPSITINDGLSIKGNETITSGTFTINPTTSTMLFTDPSVVVNVNYLNKTTFYNMVLCRGKTHTFNAGSTITINGKLLYSGTSGSPLLMRSTTPTSSYNLRVSKYATLDNTADISDCNATGGVYIKALNSVNSGNNTNVVFTYNTTTKTINNLVKKVNNTIKTLLSPAL
jgi:hypothetical protein